MCGRYVMARAAGDLAAIYGAELAEGMEFRESWNVAPTTKVPIIRDRSAPDSHREVATARWGLLPGWAKDQKLSYKTFNARSETVTEKPTFRAAVRSRRAIIPADAYYEWLKDGTQKRPHVIRPTDGSLISFAGLYEWWRDPNTDDDAPALMSCTILTGPSPAPDSGGVLEDLGALHDRIPLPVGEGVIDDWLAAEKLSSGEASALVEHVRQQAYSLASDWEIHEVGAAVGNVRNNDPSLVEPADSERLF